MRNSTLSLLAVSILTAFSVAACKHASAKSHENFATVIPTKYLDSNALVKRGEYLVNSIGCADCHSPKRMGPQGPEIIPELHLSGFPQNGQVPPINTSVLKNGWVLFASDLTTSIGPWGQSFSANITSDPSGIGNWSEENFMRAIREGKYKGLENSRNILPPMPWEVYKNLNDEDIKSLYYFLKTTTPVNNIVPAPKPLSDLE
ncbi:Cytochrome c-552 [Arenibacter antarcticus]|uniref:C-type cytochrome n=1 Tax=Arenibacter antarcticus TaxID=2040469 RepID=A0ABW5VGA1_9FLAO|nr:diheme cytochrome c-553 [Arenibacter sp. H213]MCM4167179.1 diheme cytochrome c-553 [Arenibacter sp. H213]